MEKLDGSVKRFVKKQWRDPFLPNCDYDQIIGISDTEYTFLLTK